MLIRAPAQKGPLALRVTVATFVLLAAASGVLLGSSPADAQVCWFEASDFAPPRVGVPEFGDLDGDGDYDLLYSEILRGYENTGTCKLPVWERNDELVEGLPDQLERAAACLADLDGDGDLDFSAGDVLGEAYYYENVGSASAPVWEEHNEMYPYFGEPTFLNLELIDLDGDGDFDLVLSTGSRFLQSYRNTGTPNDPIWEEDDSLCGGIEMPGGCADLSFVDVDGDGDLDLVAGNRDMYWGLVAFENVGTEYTPVWLENMDLLTGVDTDVLGIGVDLADLNGDGAPDLWSCHVEGGSFYLNGNPTTLVNSTVTWSAIKVLFR